MDKTLKLALNQYATIPGSLRVEPSLNEPVNTITVNLASLYHHYYLDSFGRTPPNPDPSQFEHVQFLMPTPDFRIQGSGLGIAPAIKKHRSNELGQAFCRWFLHDHFNIAYFAHMEHILNRQLHHSFNGCKIERIRSGDTPDYFCAESTDRVFLAEAKGRYRTISFKSKQFSDWRDQFQRVTYKDRSGVARSIKGHVVAVRYATEVDAPGVNSCLFAEDPSSRGEPLQEKGDISEIGSAIVALHYSGIADKLRQPLLALSLATGVTLPDELPIRALAWRVIVGPLEGKRFVGGVFGPIGTGPTIREIKDGVFAELFTPLRLDTPFAMFFGVEESIFRKVIDIARKTPDTSGWLETFTQLAFFNTGFSTLRDGTALGRSEFFSPEEQLTL